MTPVKAKTPVSDDRGMVEALLSDGRYLLSLSGFCLMLTGLFALLQSLSGHFLPHDSEALGMDAPGLARAANYRLVHFMFHDRVAFGGSLLAVGTAYWWLAEFPLRAKEAWAWWAFALSGACGFGSFLSYFGYGYFDLWHAVATLLLLPFFMAGLWRARLYLPGPLGVSDFWNQRHSRETGAALWGRRLLQLCGVGLLGAGATILVVGMTTVFVPQDIAFIGLTPEQIGAISPTLIPLIAHDRAGFGGGIFSTGLLVLLIARNAVITRSFVQMMALMGCCGFGAALGVHFAIGYLDLLHLAPAYAGFLAFLAGIALTAKGASHPS